jgi:hypothetical protein
MRKSHLITVAAVLAALGTTAAAEAGPAGAKTTTAPACKTGQLVATIGSPNGAAGSIYYKLRFANLGTACTLTGYPGVSAVNIEGAQLGSAASRGGGGSRTITLRAATVNAVFSTASATLQIVEAGNFPVARCHQTLAAGLRIYPPNQKTALAVPLPFDACAQRGTTYISVGPVNEPRRAG